MEATERNAGGGATLGRWGARVLAVVAVAAATIALIVVVTSSLDSAPEERKRSDRGEKREQPQSPTADSYVVQPGDTLAGIAAEQNVPVERLEELNPDIDPQALPSGATLKLR